LKIEIIFVKRTTLSSVKGMAEVVWSDLAARDKLWRVTVTVWIYNFNRSMRERLRN